MKVVSVSDEGCFSIWWRLFQKHVVYN